MTQLPILYSFRRCPYAMRARLGLAAAGVEVALREIVLRDKPAAFLDTSPTGTVPCLSASGQVIDESLDIMIWALNQRDPEGWLEMPAEGWDWITEADGPFKKALDRTKYATRYPAEDPEAQRAKAHRFLSRLNMQIGPQTTTQSESWIFDRPTLADYAILPFVRQFAFIDKALFDAQDWPHLQGWLARFLSSPRFDAVMTKYPQWQEGDAVTCFP